MKSLSLSNDLVTTFSIFDDLIALLKLKTNTIGRPSTLTFSEIAVISLLKVRFDIKTWKGLYKLLTDRYSSDFNLPCYKNFVETMNRDSFVLVMFIEILLQMNNTKSGKIKLVDSTPLPVCKNIRIPCHKTMKSIASRSKGTMGWYYGLKLHVVCDIKGNLIALKFTTANVGDRKVLDKFLEELSNSVIIADAGYVSKKLEKKATKRGNILKTCSRKNMKRIATYIDIQQLNLRLNVETLFSVLKERLNMVTSLPRSVGGYLAHYIHVIFGYTFNKLIS